MKCDIEYKLYFKNSIKRGVKKENITKYKDWCDGVLYGLKAGKQYNYNQPSVEELIETFPEGFEILKRNLKKFKKERRIKSILLKYCIKKIFKALGSDLTKKYKGDLLRILYTNQLKILDKRIKTTEKIIKRYEWEKYPEYIKEKINKKKVDRRDIDNARSFSLSRLIDLNYGDFGICPFHNDRSPSLKVYRDENKYHCFGCGESGDVIDFVMKKYKLNFNQAINKLKYGILHKEATKQS